MIFNIEYKIGNTNICIRYVGQPKKIGINHEKNKEYLKKILKNSKFEDLETIVKYVRTVFKDYNEISLVISKDSKKESTYISYQDGKIISYRNTSDILHKNKITFRYEGEDGFSINSSNLLNYDYLKFEDFINNRIKSFYDLINIKLNKLTKQDKILIEVYEKFYGEKPDFSSKEIELKIQNMLYILSQYGVILLNNNGSCVEFSINENNLESNDIKKWVKELMPFGNNIKFINDAELDGNTVRITQIVGNEVMKELVEIEEEKRTDTFREFCNIHYLKKNWYSKPNSVNALLQSQKIDSEDVVNKHLQLIRRIDKQFLK